MIISNTLGANTLDILLSLGLPWFVKCIMPASHGGGPISFDTNDLAFNTIGLAFCVILLNVISAVNCFNMNRLFGVACLTAYFMVTAFFIIVSLGLVRIANITESTSC